MIELRASYAWLSDEIARQGHPLMVKALLDLYGLHEGVGAADNPQILSWAHELGVADVYRHDSTAWCGLVMGHAAHAAHKKMTCFEKPRDMLWALNWAKFGKPSLGAALGDVLVFRRFSKAGDLIGGHVGLYVGQDDTAYHVLAGNQGDAVSIARVPRKRLFAVRRPDYMVTPPNVRRIDLAPAGALSQNEA